MLRSTRSDHVAECDFGTVQEQARWVEEMERRTVTKEVCKYCGVIWALPLKENCCEKCSPIVAKAKLEAQYKPKKRWLKFVDNSNPKNKTKHILGYNQKEENIFDVRWHNGWRQYVFDDGELVLAEGCLHEIFEKVKDLREEREKELNRGGKGVGDT